MTLTLGSVSSPVVDGRCTGCGRFIAVTESHFHAPHRVKALQCEGHSWSYGMKRCRNLTRRRHPSRSDLPLCWTHGGVPV